DPQVASLFQIVGEFFDVVMQPAGEEPKEEDIRSEDGDCQLVPAEEPDDEDLDDAELAAALGAKQASKASCPRGSVESLHTGLTSDLEKVKMTESPGVQIVTPPAHVLAMAEKQQKIQTLKYPGVLEQEIEKRKRSLQCAGPWKQQKTAPAEQETQVTDLSPVAKCLQDEFDAAAVPGSPKASGASASKVDPDLDESDLFNAQPTEFLTRESQFAAKGKQEQEEEEDDD
ncbi:CRYD, partial [Symbiodinium necroappetens]